jgi:hypothetical protein
VSKRLTYRDYLIWKATHTAASLNDAIRTALDLRDETDAIRHLERALEVAVVLAQPHSTPNPERVAPRPEEVASE